MINRAILEVIFEMKQGSVAYIPQIPTSSCSGRSAELETMHVMLSFCLAALCQSATSASGGFTATDSYGVFPATLKEKLVSILSTRADTCLLTHGHSKVLEVPCLDENRAWALKPANHTFSCLHRREHTSTSSFDLVITIPCHKMSLQPLVIWFVPTCSARQLTLSTIWL